MAPESSVLATTANGLDGMVSTMPTEVALPFAAPDRGTLRKLLPAAIVVVAAAVFVLAARGPAHALIGALHRAVNADPRWVVAAIAFEAASFAGYIALFWHVASRESERIGLRTSYEVTLAGAAATRLLPTAGAGGAVLTFWTLRRAGGQPAGAARTLLAFLVLLYSVFLVSVLVAGGLLATGVVASPGPVELSALPAVVAGTGIAVALALARRHRRAA